MASTKKKAGTKPVKLKAGAPKKAPSKNKKASKGENTGPKRWRVPLCGGIVKVGSDSFRLDVTGHMHVHANTAKDAQEIADAILEKWAENGEAHGSSEPLELETLTPLQAKAGDVESLVSECEQDETTPTDLDTVAANGAEAVKLDGCTDGETPAACSSVTASSPSPTVPRFSQDVEPS